MRYTRYSLRRHAAITILLMMAMLYAQWSGLSHRIEHGFSAQVHASDTSSEDHEDDTDALHSCVAFDAVTVGDTVAIRPYIAPLLSSPQVLALWAAFDSWDAPLDRHFSPRAPPLA